MQCYAYQLMLAAVHEAIVCVEPGFRYDQLILGEVLDELGVKAVQDLRLIDRGLIADRAAPYLNAYRRAA